MGKVNYERAESEKSNAQFRRSLYVVSNIAEGEAFTEENIKSIRPGFGMAPKLLNKIIGKKAAKNLKKGMALKPELIK